MKLEMQDKPITFDEALQKSELSHLHEVIHYLENTPDEAIFPEKIEATAQYMANLHVNTLFKENPNMPIKNVISSVLEHLPDTLTSAMLKNITQKIIKNWDKKVKSPKKQVSLTR
jgi:uncharacterized protein YjgD (DUF1641 family)